MEELAKISLASHPDRRYRTYLIAELTERAMKGEIDFAAALSRRLELLRARRAHIDELVARLRRKITPSFVRSFTAHGDFWSRQRLFIVSGGFRECIVPVAAQFGIAEDRVYANQFMMDDRDMIVGCNKRNPLAQAGGKAEVVRLIKERTGPMPAVIIGDGWTDYEVRKRGAADRFFVFTENVRRPAVVALADAEAAQAEDIIPLMHDISSKERDYDSKT